MQCYGLAVAGMRHPTPTHILHGVQYKLYGILQQSMHGIRMDLWCIANAAIEWILVRLPALPN